MSGFDLTGPIVLLGTLTGLGYALLAVGLVLTYRSSRVINFAHGAVGLFVAGLFAVVVGRYDVPYLLGFPAALLCGALVGAALEALIVRRLAAAPRVLVMVATLGIGEALLLLSLSFNSGGLGGRTFPPADALPLLRGGAAVHPAGADRAADPHAGAARGAGAVPGPVPLRRGDARRRLESRRGDAGGGRPPVHVDAGLGARRPGRHLLGCC